MGEVYKTTSLCGNLNKLNSMNKNWVTVAHLRAPAVNSCVTYFDNESKYGIIKPIKKNMDSVIEY